MGLGYCDGCGPGGGGGGEEVGCMVRVLCIVVLYRFNVS